MHFFKLAYASFVEVVKYLFPGLLRVFLYCTPQVVTNLAGNIELKPLVIR